MHRSSNDDIGKLIIRLVLGATVLLHGIAKLTGGVGGIRGMLQSAGLPGDLAWAVLIGKVLGPLLLIAGFHARLGAGLVAINMLFAIGLAHMGELLVLNQQGGWAIELQAMFLFTAVGLVLTGPGRIGINTR